MSDEQRLERVENKIDVVVAHISDIKATLAVNTESLAYHIKRTDLLEKKLEPVEVHVQRVSGVFKFIGLLASVAAIVEVLFLFFK